MANHFLHRWEGGLADDTLGVLLRSAPTHPAAAERMRTIFTEQRNARRSRPSARRSAAVQDRWEIPCCRANPR
ncbi:MAG: hypothetical protein ACRDQ4_21205 [Pseudonocardiaceae bacterium]